MNPHTNGIPVSLSSPFPMEALWGCTNQQPQSENRTLVAPACLCRDSGGSEGTSVMILTIPKSSWEKQSPPGNCRVNILSLSWVTQVGSLGQLPLTCPKGLSPLLSSEYIWTMVPRPPNWPGSHHYNGHSQVGKLVWERKRWCLGPSCL